MSRKVWCVQWREIERIESHRTIKTEWCATFRGAKPDHNAVSDRTACGMVVVFRFGDAKRQPTCGDCKLVVARRKRGANESQ